MEIKCISLCLKWILIFRRIEDDTWKLSSASPFDMVGTNIKGKTIGIMGLGRIGLAVAKRFQGFKFEKI